ncbi:MAG: hypothetical protein M3506_03630 [Chloroflexota bacterium]|nr:hypothetical protein [Chloroflexota bacterium]
MTVLLPLLALVLASCGSDVAGRGDAERAEPTVALPRGVVATERCGGGLDDRARTTTVYSSGIVELREGRKANGPLLHSTRVPVADVRELYKVLRSREWQRLNASYGEVIPDGEGCTISGADKSVTGLSGEMPDIVYEVWGRFSRMESGAQVIVVAIRDGPRGKTRWIGVHRDGTVKLRAGRGSEGAVIGLTRVPSSNVRQLEAAMSTQGWYPRDRTYGHTSAVASSYIISGPGSLVTIYDGAALPEAVAAVHRQVRALWSGSERAKVRPTPTGSP